MLFRAKSQQLKVLGKAAILPGLFNINEPVIFGAPIVYNPYLIIPFIVTPLINVTIAYFATSFGFVAKVITGIPWISPVGIGAFLGTGGDFRGILIAILNLLISVVCYYPFFRMYDSKLLRSSKQTKQKRLSMISRKERGTKVKTLLSHALNTSKWRKQKQLREINRTTPKFEKQFPCIPPYFAEFNISVAASF